MSSQASRAKVRASLVANGLDAVIAVSRENIQFLSGFRPLLWGLESSFCLTYADAAKPLALFVNELELTRATSESSADTVHGIPARFEIDEIGQLRAGTTVSRTKRAAANSSDSILLIAAMLKEAEIVRGRIGCELSLFSAQDYQAIKQALPEVELCDVNEIFFDLRAVKTEAEIHWLSAAARMADHALQSVIDGGIRGRSAAQINLHFQSALLTMALNAPDVLSLTGADGWFTVGGEIGPASLVNHDIAHEGCLFFADYGAQVNGYSSDVGRSFSVGSPDPLSERIMSALLAAHELVLPMLKPGTVMGDVFEVAQDAIRSRGFPTYTRGNFGHMAGLGSAQQPPYFSRDQKRRLDAGMVLCFETPYYVRGLGGHQLEEMYLITPTGAEKLNLLPLQFASIA
jgi:Xaa-Pro aminopeptidase